MVAVAVQQRPSMRYQPGGRSASARPTADELGVLGQVTTRPTTAVVARRRCQVVGAFAVAFAACAVWAQAGVTVRPGNGPLAVPGAGRTQAVAAHVWVVQPGETVWGIAHQLQPKGDAPPLVDQLDRQLHGRPLQIGQQLQLP